MYEIYGMTDCDLEFKVKTMLSEGLNVEICRVVLKIKFTTLNDFSQ